MGRSYRKEVGTKLIVAGPAAHLDDWKGTRALAQDPAQILQKRSHRLRYGNAGGRGFAGLLRQVFSSG